MSPKKDEERERCTRKAAEEEDAEPGEERKKND